MGSKPRPPRRIRVRGYIRSPDPDIRDRLGATFARNCPVGIRAGDGAPLGSCMYWLGQSGNDCPRHGDVSNSLWITSFMVDRSEMKKYGVEYDDSTFGSSAIKKCPKCGEDLPQENGKHILHCPNCGTEPFERSKRED